MPSRTTRQPSSRATLLRNVGFVVAVALGAVGIWLIVTGRSMQRVEIGVLTGLWGLLLGAICGRRMVLSESAPPQYPAAPSELTPVDAAGATSPAEAGAVAVRAAAPVDRRDDAEARLAFEAGLQNLLSREIGALRDEIAQLRQELVDKVGGQLRLERIETTRLIGSDLEAMRAEVRRLKLADAQLVDADGQPIDAGDQFVDAERVVDDVQVREVAEVREVTGATSETTRIPRIAPEQPEPEPEPEPAARPAPQPAPQPAAGADDPFASLPRLTPFTEFPLDPVDDPGQHDTTGAAPRIPAGSTDSAVDDPHAGRRRRHGAGDEPEPPADEPTGRRHHRADDGGDDLLARLLAREGVRR